MSLFRPYQYKSRPDLVPGKGMVKNGFFQFFELYFRKFWRFISTNLCYFLITLPMVIYAFYLINGIFADRLEAMGEGYILFAGVGFIASFFSFIPTWLNTPLLVLSVLLYGPITMGLTYMYRNFAREEHAWASDLWSRAWSNARQGLFFGIMDLLLTCLFIWGMFGRLAAEGRNLSFALSAILSVISGIALVIWLFMRHYTYLMAVTINLSVFQILKNAWLFVVLGFRRNVTSGVVTLACIVVTFLLAPLITVITLPLFFYSFSWFCTVFTCYPIVKKYLVLPALEAEQAGKAVVKVDETDLLTEAGNAADPEETEE
jgi:hypothetical protein